MYFVRREISICMHDPSAERKLVLVLPAIPSTGSAPALEFPVKVCQLIDGIGPADLGIFFFAEPRKPLFEQLEHPLDKGPRWAILWTHRITSIVVVVKLKGGLRFHAFSTEKAELYGRCRRRPWHVLDLSPGGFDQMDAVLI